MEILQFELTGFAENCYVVRDEGEAIVIDPGDSTPALLECLDGYRVRMIVCTHGHCDHCGGNAGLVEATGAPLAMHREDLPLLNGLSEQGAMLGMAFSESPEPDRYLVEGDTVEVGGTSFAVLHVPGHSPGHIALYTEGTVFVGDVLFAGGIGRTDLPGGSYEQLIDTIRTKLLTLPDETVVYSGHGPSTTIGAERRTNPFLVTP